MGTDAEGKQVLLVVEDDPDLREMLCLTLANPTLDIVVAEDGLYGLEKLRLFPVEAVVTDLRMPRMTGLEFMATAKREGFDVPFIVLTGFGTLSDATQALRLGCFDFLQKPGELRELPGKVAEALRVYREQRRVVELLMATEEAKVLNETAEHGAAGAGQLSRSPEAVRLARSLARMMALRERKVG